MTQDNEKDLNPIQSPSETVNLMDGIMTDLNEKHINEAADRLAQDCQRKVQDENMKTMEAIQINEAVARKLGWTYNEKHKHWHQPTSESGGNCWDFPDFANNIEAAWEIVLAHPEDNLCWKYPGRSETAMSQFGITLLENGQWRAGWGNTSPYEEFFDVYAEADTAPRAICLAFLKLP